LKIKNKNTEAIQKTKQHKNTKIQKYSKTKINTRNLLRILIC